MVSLLTIPARVFARIDSEKFQECFINWIQSIGKITEGKVVAIDGKTLRHSYDRGAERGAIHMISAWAAENRLVLGQVKVAQKSNEISAIPELLEVLNLEGCIVTIDAMGCQKTIVEAIGKKEADYIITVKRNQPNLYENIEGLFKEAIKKGFEGLQHSSYSSKELSHGRSSTRNYLMLTDLAEQVDPDRKWLNLKSVGLVESVRTINGKTTIETRYYITSLGNNAKLLGNSVRSHWGIENNLHWLLDVAFREDDKKVSSEKWGSPSHNS